MLALIETALEAINKIVWDVSYFLLEEALRQMGFLD